MNVVQAKSTCATFDELRYNIYTSKNKTLTELPPTSSTIRGHLLHCHYFVRVCVTLLDLETSELSEKNQTSIPEEYTLPVLAKKGAREDVAANEMRNNVQSTASVKTVQTSRSTELDTA